MADSLQTAGECVEEKATDELIDLQGHGLLAVLMPVVLPTEGDSILLSTDQSMIGNGDPMRIAAQIIQDLLRATEGPFGIDDPFGVAQGGEVLSKGPRIAQRLERGEERQPPGLEGLLETLQEQPAEESREHAHGKEEARTAGDPALVIG